MLSEQAHFRRLHPLAVLPVEMPVLRLQQPRAPRADRRGALRPRLCRRDRRHGGAGAGPHRLDDFLRRRHAVADAAGNDRRRARRRGEALARRARRRGHARSQSDQRRGDALSRLSHGRRQPRLARRAGARRPRAGRAWPHAHVARGARRRRRRALDLRPLFVRPDLCPAAATAGAMGGRAQARAGRGRRASFALSTDHRAGHAVRRASRRRQAQNARRGHRARALRHDPGDLRGPRSAGL